MLNSVIIHFHIFKNAGTTVDWILHKNFGKDSIKFDDKDNPANIYTQDKILDVIKKYPNAKSVSSHQIRFPLPKSSNEILIPIIFVRHSIDRAFSLYTFAKRDNRDTGFNQVAKSSTLQEFIRFNLENKNENHMKNPQTRWLSQEIKEFNPPLRLARAIENITSCSILGIVDRMDESLVVAEEVLKPYFPNIDMSYVSQNVSKERASTLEERLDKAREEIGKELWNRLVKRNEQDMQVYTNANNELDNRIRSINKFEEKLTDFRQRCKALSVTE
jgi:hypothetical protein